MTGEAGGSWLAEAWSSVRPMLPRPPARVVEIGCGDKGGLVPRLTASGYDAVGVDPAAPDRPGYRREPFEAARFDRQVDAVVAVTALHHVADPDAVAGLMHELLVPGGVLALIEWARELFDEPTARWCFARLPGAEEHCWLREQRDAWRDSGLPWDEHLRRWAAQDGVHTGERVLAAVDARFVADRLDYGPYFFADLDRVRPADEQAAIDAGAIRATGIRYAGRPR